jgi:DNA-binding MarR family transcriptional regulator
VSAKDEPAQISVAEIRGALRKRHLEEAIGDGDVIDRMEIMFNLMRLTTRLTRDFEATHRPVGWTWAGFRIANLLWAAGDLEPRDLARLSGSSRASISSALNTLESGGYIRRTIRATNRRSIVVSLTEKGRQELKRAIAAQADRERAWLDVLTPGERATLGKLISRLHDQP